MIFLLFLYQNLSADVYFSTTDWSGYADGPLMGQNGWAQFIDTGSNDIMVSEGRVIWGDDVDILTFPLDKTLSEGEQIFYAMQITVIGGNGVHFFAGFRYDSSFQVAASSSLDFVGDGDYRFGLTNTGSVNVRWDYGSIYGKEYLLVVGYDFDTGLSKMWVNPVDANSKSIITKPALAGRTVTRFYLQGGDGDGSVHSLRGLAIADTFHEALNALASDKIQPLPDTINLFYFTHELPEGITTREAMKPYVSYVDAQGEIRDQLMDSFAFSDQTRFKDFPGDITGHYSELREYLGEIFDASMNNRSGTIAIDNSENAAGSTGGAAVITEKYHGITYKSIPVTPGSNYALSPQLRSDSDAVTEEGFVLGFSIFDVYGNEITHTGHSGDHYSDYYGMFWNQSYSRSPTTSWHRWSQPFSITVPEKSATMNVYILKSQAVETLWVDNVILTENGSGNLITDPEFDLPPESSPWIPSRIHRSLSAAGRFLFDDEIPLASGIAECLQDQIDNLGFARPVKFYFMFPPLFNLDCKDQDKDGIPECPEKAWTDVYDLNNASLMATFHQTMEQYLNDIQTMFTTWKSNYAHLDIAIGGMYWFEEALFKNEGIHPLFHFEEREAIMDQLNMMCDARNWRLLGSPYNISHQPLSINCAFHPDVFDKFDQLFVQPNTWFRGNGGNGNYDLEMLKLMHEELIEPRENLLVNIENRSLRADLGEPYGRLLDYLDYGYKYGYVNGKHMFYDDAGAHWKNSYSEDLLLRQDYDELYRFIHKSRTGFIPNGDFENLPSKADMVRYARFSPALPADPLIRWSGNYGIHSINQFGHEDSDQGLTSSIPREHRFTTNVGAMLQSDPMIISKDRMGTLRFDHSASHFGMISKVIFRFFDEAGTPITIGASQNLVYDAQPTIQGWVHSIISKITSTEESIPFEAPLNAVTMELVFHTTQDHCNDPEMKESGACDSRAFTNWSSVQVHRSSSYQPITLYRITSNKAPNPLAFGYFFDQGFRSLALTGGQHAQMKHPMLIEDAGSYTLSFDWKNAYPVLNQLDNQSAVIFSFVFYDEEGNPLSSTDSNLVYNADDGRERYEYAMPYNTHLEAYEWTSSNFTFTPPSFAVSARLHVNVYGLASEVHFDNFRIELNTHPSFPTDLLAKPEFNWQLDSQRFNDGLWSQSSPMRTQQRNQPLFTEILDLSQVDQFRVETQVREIFSDHYPADGRIRANAHMSVELFDSKWKIIDNQYELSDPIDGVEWSETDNCWFTPVPDLNRGTITYPNGDRGGYWFESQWIECDWSIILPPEAAFARLLFVKENTSEYEVVFARPRITANVLIPENDSDSDGIDDSLELELFDSLTGQGGDDDSDGDNISNRREIALGLNPLIADSDGDGISDGLELILGFDALVSNVSLTESILDEIRSSTDRMAETGLFTEKAIGNIYASTPMISAQGDEVNLTFKLQYTDSLDSKKWIDFGDPAVWSDRKKGKAFYRIIFEPKK